MERFLTQHFVTILLIIVFSLKLASSRESKDTQIRYLWLSVICTALLVFQDVFESMSSEDPSLSAWRTLLSVLGYVLRPVAALGILLVIAGRYPHRELLWMPAWINAAVMCTAFFSPLAFYFDERYAFTLGPLGYCPFIVGFLYIGIILIFIWKRYGFHFTPESLALYFCAIGTIICTLIDHFHGDSRLNTAIMISAIFYYMFLQSHDVNLDQLTELMNRTAFYRDMETRSGSITAMAMLSMLNLRAVNDTLGYRAADEALIDIGKCFQNVSSKQISCYRLGNGDFIMVFYNGSEKDARTALQLVQAAIQGIGHRMASGLAVRSSAESTDDLFRRSEAAMRADRVAFYQRPANNRRRSETNSNA